jgi:hypothetical protein
VFVRDGVSVEVEFTTVELIVLLVDTYRGRSGAVDGNARPCRGDADG